MAKSVKRKEEYFIKKLKETPRKIKFDLHYWADFIELRCLFNLDGVFTRDDFIDCYNSNKDFLPKHSDIETEEDDPDEHDDEGYDEIVSDDRSAKNDRDEKFSDDCFRILESRSKLFSKYYPFLISKDVRCISKKKQFTWQNHCYLFLLFSSSLGYFKDYKTTLTSSFEIFSLYVLKSILPKTAQAHLFGSSNSILKNRRYVGHIWDKLQKLKTDLNETLIKAKKSDFSKNDSGDTGIDLVAWISAGDSQPNIITYTGQAACTDKWYSKKYSSSNSALQAIIPISVPVVNLVFIPFSVRKSNGQWHRAHDIGDCVLVDRQRLLFYFSNNKKLFDSLPCAQLIAQLLKIKGTVLN